LVLKGRIKYKRRRKPKPEGIRYFNMKVKLNNFGSELKCYKLSKKNTTSAIEMQAKVGSYATCFEKGAGVFSRQGLLV
jgi:hypothetical protein